MSELGETAIACQVGMRQHQKERADKLRKGEDLAEFARHMMDRGMDLLEKKVRLETETETEQRPQAATGNGHSSPFDDDDPGHIFVSRRSGVCTWCHKKYEAGVEIGVHHGKYYHTVPNCFDLRL